MSKAAVTDGEPPEAGPDHIFRLGFGFRHAKVVLSAVELGVFTELAKQPLDAAGLIARLGLHGRGARDFFDALVALGLLERADGVYRNTETASAFLDRAKPGAYLGGMLEFATEIWYEAWGNLTESLRTGLQQNNLGGHGTIPFDVLYSDPAQVRKFQRATTAASLAGIRVIAERAPWAEYRSVADIGCSEGALLAEVLGRQPHLTGIGFDLPAVRMFFADTAKVSGLGDRLRFTPGSFFTGPLPSADVLVFGHILRDWDLDTKRMLLRKAFQALPPGGMVLSYDTLIDDERRESACGLLSSLHQLLESPGGFGYTGADCLGWLADAGFRDCRVEALGGFESMVLGFK